MPADAGGCWWMPADAGGCWWMPADAGENPRRQLKPLKGRDEYSLRIGKRRTIVDWVTAQDERRVLEIDTRDTVYR